MFRVVVEKERVFLLQLVQLLPRLASNCCGPTLSLLQLIRGVLGIVYEKIGISGKSHYIRVYSIPMLHIGTINKGFSPSIIR